MRKSEISAERKQIIIKKLSLESVFKAIDTFHEKVDALDYKLNYSEKAKASQKKLDAASEKVDELFEKAGEKVAEGVGVAFAVTAKVLRLDEEPLKPGTWQAERAERHLQAAQAYERRRAQAAAIEESERQLEMNSLRYKYDAESRDRLRQLKEESEKYQDQLRRTEEWENREREEQRKKKEQEEQTNEQYQLIAFKKAIRTNPMVKEMVRLINERNGTIESIKIMQDKMECYDINRRLLFSLYYKEYNYPNLNNSQINVLCQYLAGALAQRYHYNVSNPGQLISQKEMHETGFVK